MGIKKTLMLSAFFVPALLQAQQVDTLAVVQQRAQNENADFSFTESQLDEDDDAGQTVSAITGVNNDLYLSEVGYLFSPMRFRLRAYKNTSNDMFVNGVPFKDTERGVFNYSSIGGLNDVTRNREGSPFFLMNQFDNAPFDLFDKLLPLVFQQFKSDRLQFALQSDFLLVFQRLFQPDFS